MLVFSLPVNMQLESQRVSHFQNRRKARIPSAGKCFVQALTAQPGVLHTTGARAMVPSALAMNAASPFVSSMQASRYRTMPSSILRYSALSHLRNFNPKFPNYCNEAGGLKPSFE